MPTAIENVREAGEALVGDTRHGFSGAFRQTHYPGLSGRPAEKARIKEKQPPLLEAVGPADEPPGLWGCRKSMVESADSVNS